MTYGYRRRRRDPMLRQQVTCSEIYLQKMSPDGRVMVARNLLALAVCTGVCYCVYRALSAGRKKHGSGTRDRAPPGGHGRSPESRSEAIPKSASNLERHDLETLLQILSSNSDASAQEQILITLCNISAFSINHDIIRNLDGIRIIGGFLSHADPKIKAGALNVLNNLSLNLPNQEQIQAFINEVLKDITECSINSEVQLAGLRLVINMSVTNKYHEKMEDYIPNLLNLLDEGNDTTKIHTLKLLVNMSANPLMTRPLLASKAPSLFLSLCDGSINRDVLIRALSFTANLSENLAKEQQYDGPRHLKEDSIYAVLFKDPAVLQRNLVPLLLFPDMEIKEEAYRCIRSTETLLM